MKLSWFDRQILYNKERMDVEHYRVLDMMNNYTFFRMKGVVLVCNYVTTARALYRYLIKHFAGEGVAIISKTLDMKQLTREYKKLQLPPSFCRFVIFVRSAERMGMPLNKIKDRPILFIGI